MLECSAAWLGRLPGIFIQAVRIPFLPKPTLWFPFLLIFSFEGLQHSHLRISNIISLRIPDTFSPDDPQHSRLRVLTILWGSPTILVRRISILPFEDLRHSRHETKTRPSLSLLQDEFKIKTTLMAKINFAADKSFCFDFYSEWLFSGLDKKLEPLQLRFQGFLEARSKTFHKISIIESYKHVYFGYQNFSLFYCHLKNTGSNITHCNQPALLSMTRSHSRCQPCSVCAFKLLWICRLFEHSIPAVTVLIQDSQLIGWYHNSYITHTIFFTITLTFSKTLCFVEATTSIKMEL